jgi:hypothetical protein
MNGRSLRRESIGWAAAILLVCVAAGVLRLRAVQREAAEVVAREDAARRLLERIRDAETVHHERTGTYAWLDDLEGIETVRGEGRAVAATPGYRIDLLLPTERRAGDRLRLAVRGEAEPDLALAKRHFAAVARPTDPGISGFRTWYLDERGDLFHSEGVVDPEALAHGALPEWAVRGEASRDSPSAILWRRSP